MEFRRVLFRSRSLVFKAEDGIRDATVTGVQTCALPIQAEDGIRDATVNSSHGSISYAVFCLDRKSVVQGKSVDLGGRRIIKKKTNSPGFSSARPRTRVSASAARWGRTALL